MWLLSDENSNNITDLAAGYAVTDLEINEYLELAFVTLN